ncbi:MAG: hypothetical protein J5J00_17025 [Deltaproteobacteria bacterium]|nr:hypothetical protein [Deltaproteobacteria bacterium]
MGSKKKRERDRRQRQAEVRQRFEQEQQQRADQNLLANDLLSQFYAVFGEHSAEILKMASKGSSPEEIAEKLGMDLAQAEKAVEAFCRLPPKIVDLLERAPTLLQKGDEVRSMIRSHLRAARQQRRPW